MSGPILPKGSSPVPPAGSDTNPADVTKVGPPPALNTQGFVISVIAERLRIGKRVVEGEGVRVVTDEEATPANVTLRSERIEVERVAGVRRERRDNHSNYGISGRHRNPLGAERGAAHPPRRRDA